jgi:hypothetical protein
MKGFRKVAGALARQADTKLPTVRSNRDPRMEMG